MVKPELYMRQGQTVAHVYHIQQCHLESLPIDHIKCICTTLGSRLPFSSLLWRFPRLPHLLLQTDQSHFPKILTFYDHMHHGSLDASKPANRSVNPVVCLFERCITTELYSKHNHASPVSRTEVG